MGDIRARWAWVEPEVWTERMLATLETGIEGGKWFRLIDKVWSPKNLAGSLRKVVAKGGSAGIDKEEAGVMDRMKGWQATEQGSPQGAGISPAIIQYLPHGVDWKMARKGFEMVR